MLPRNRQTDINTPEHVQPIRQGCPLTLNLCSRRLLDQSRSFGQVEFTQPLGVGLGLAVRINNQYSRPVCTGRRTDDFATINDSQDPVCTGRCTDDYMTINDMWEI